MPTKESLVRCGRSKKKLKNKSCSRRKMQPQISGTVTKVYTMTPKKPNSALRKVTKVKLSNGDEVICYIPGIGHDIQVNKIVLVRRGGPKDLPGVKYTIIRGKGDASGVSNRKSSRSKYGVKKSAVANRA